MGSVNRVILIGNLGANPEAKQLPSGQSVANLSLATQDTWKAKDGSKQSRTEWHRIVCWGQLAELATKYLSKGRQVYVEGRLQTEKYENKKGETHYTTKVVAERLVFLGSGGQRREEEKGEAWEPPAEGAAPPAGDDDIPF